MKLNEGLLESNVPFAESIIWKLNRAYYENAGLSAWSDGVVPHNLTSSAFVGKTYAALIMGFLKDIAAERILDKTKNLSDSDPIDEEERVHIIELGSGHGRLAFHILQQLEHMVDMEKVNLPSYCLVLTDIVESNLEFFQNNPQFQNFIEQGKLDVAHFDGVHGKEIVLRNSELVITNETLTYPILAIANYFFDSLPNDLYKIDGDVLSACNITVASEFSLDKVSPSKLLESLRTSIHKAETSIPLQSEVISKLLGEYTSALNNTYLLMPRQSIECIETLHKFSKKGLLLISMDKGFSEMDELKNNPQPELVGHGAFSMYVNFHAISRFCEHSGGMSLFSSFSDFSLKLACLLFVANPSDYKETLNAYDHYVNDFGPDDFVGMKKVLMNNLDNTTLRELISSMRMSYYDSTLFLQMLPYLKKHVVNLTKEERQRLAQTLTKIGANYFAIKEPIDAIYEIGGLLYDLGYYKKALKMFKEAILISGVKADIYYNIILCYYQLRQDLNFAKTMSKAKSEFPEFEKFKELELLDLNAI